MALQQYGEALERTLGNLLHPLDIIVCIDGSSSVTAENWELEKLCAKLLLRRLPFDVNKTRVACLQFTNAASMITPFTVSFEEVGAALAVCKQLKQGTSAKAVLHSAIAMFQQDNRNAARAVLLLTDGDVTDAIGDPFITQNVQVLKIKLLVCGIGLDASAHRSVLALSPDCAVFFTSFPEMQSCLTAITVQPRDPPVLSIRTKSMTRVSFDVVANGSVGEAMLEACEAAGAQWRQVGTTNTAVVCATRLQPGTAYRFRVRARLPNNGPWTSYSAETALETLKHRPEAEDLSDKERCNVKLREMRRALQELRLTGIFADADIAALNVLLLGRMANGKSSLLNTLATALTGKYKQIALAGERNGGGTFTLKISKPEVLDSLKVWDTYGWDGTNWSDNEINLLLTGRIKEGYEFGKQITTALNDRPSLADKVHAVLIVCDLHSASSIAQMQELGKFYQILTNHHLQPIIALTKPDSVTASTDHPEERLTAGAIGQVYDNGLLDAAINTFCKHTKISRNFCFPVLNYTGVAERNSDAQDLLALYPLSAAVDQARQFVTDELQRSVRFIDAKTKERVGRCDLLLRDGETDSTVNVLREATANHTKFTGVPGLVGYKFLTKNGRELGPDEEKEFKIHQCRVKDGEQRYVICLARSAAPAPAAATLASPAVAAAQPSTPSSPVTPATGGVALVKVSLRWEQVDNPLAGIEVPGDATAARLRDAIVAEGVTEEIGGKAFAFAFPRKLGAPLDPSLETATAVSALYQPGGERVVLLVAVPAEPAPTALLAARSAKVSVILVKAGGVKESIGYIEDVAADATLEAVRREKLTADNVEDLPGEYRFLDQQGDPVVLAKEKSTRLLDKCTRQDEKGNLSFHIKAK